MNLYAVLVVDDSATSRMIIKRCFEMAGYNNCEFFEAEDGLKAMSLLNKKDVDLVVTDLNMPKMDGSTFIKKLRMMDRTMRLPVLVISSMGSDLIEEQLIQQGVLGIIRKPMTPEKVIEAVGEAV